MNSLPWYIEAMKLDLEAGAVALPVVTKKSPLFRLAADK